jgi:hypothetical protein
MNKKEEKRIRGERRRSFDHWWMNEMEKQFAKDSKRTQAALKRIFRSTWELAFDRGAMAALFGEVG